MRLIALGKSYSRSRLDSRRVPAKTSPSSIAAQEYDVQWERFVPCSSLRLRYSMLSRGSALHRGQGENTLIRPAVDAFLHLHEVFPCRFA
jgi:hypothetical protein